MLFACRACKVPLTAPTSSCAICSPIRKNLVVVGELEEDRPSLSGTGNEVVRLLRAQIRRVRELLDKNADDVKAGARLIALTNSTAKLLGEVRKLQEDGAAAIENMAFAEQAELFVGWAMGLPPSYRSDLMVKLAEFEAQLSVPIKDQPSPEPS